ncbi:DEAD/DEAH box helicase [Janthinobacterium fluminis]|uniref:AAA domain-containing protein n=1 Tax=Janthinobacterium fluminis TaxID=2987524 RepID=A0ABT5JZH0_9BURK|nr:AAA domain-containing protein [Janthinobacterium fluminis]MDC8758109.1 AAA domain-containing protein [Janthinobacterium fluminis]
MTQAEQQRLLAILEYWHKIEFFIPFDLAQVSDTPDEWKLRWLTRGDLATLPSTFLTQLRVPPELRISGFKLFLGVFDKAEIARAGNAVASPSEQLEEAEKGALQGRSCFARITLNAAGEPNFDPVSVSTVPWALGRGLNALGLDAFDDAQQDLKDRLRNFHAARRPAVAADADSAPTAPLDGAEILALFELFTAWADFTPAHAQPVALLEIGTEKIPAQKERAADAPPAQENGELDFTAAPEASVDILNSFYIEDLERAICAVRGGAVPATLAAYLTPLAPARRTDLYTDAGRQCIIDMLHPARGNRGHWLEDAGRSMSLMQQFAVNAGLRHVAERGLFSVNGPPGTGKTTLLRELFAENIVRRAAVLARLERAADAFCGKLRVGFNGDTRQATIARLIPELCGFEMVVASSNNAAVENISTDLPKRKQLGAAWSGASYLQPVAQRLAAEGDDGRVKPLAAGELPWGLISCALGKSQNRKRFVAKFYYDGKQRAAQAGAMQHIRLWLENYRGIGFQQAAAEFRAAAQAVEAALAELADYADLWRGAGLLTRAQFCRAGQTRLELAAAQEEAAQQALAGAEGALATLLDDKAALQEEERLLDRAAPGFFARLLRTAAARRHRAEVAANADAQRGAGRAIAAAKTRIASALAPQHARAAGEAATARAAVAALQRDWDTAQARLAAYRSRYPDLAPPDQPAQLEQDQVQIAGLWHDAALAQLRSALFAKALALHEAWLAEVAQKGGAGFGGNLFALALLLDNKRPDDDAHVAPIWQSLFMVVPVVSTTFASFARQFRGMDAESLGWLFIDEAGQAVPQAAVGALWRARRAVVVGDPLQIEPVFTAPAQLIRKLSAQSPHTADDAYAPDKVSVQRLADAANPYGTQVAGGDGGLWIGSPLRVHRRCAEPMFSLSNNIAYGGKMVFGMRDRQPPAGAPGIGASAWIDVAGAVAFKQVVPQQIDLVAQMLLRLYRRAGELPPLYIISPFKAVQEEVRKRVLGIAWDDDTGAHAAPAKAALAQWCRDRIGTVHTFQGKEQSMVVMVLGADRDNAGAAAWAAAKPNLLNVALTRAAHYVYIVGEAAVWSAQPYFSTAHADLPKTDARSFLARIG